MEFPQGAPYTGAPFPDTEWGEANAWLTLPASGQLAYGEIVCRDISQLSGFATWNGQIPTAGYTGSSGQQCQPDMVVPAKTATVPGLVFGILKKVPSNYESNQVAVDGGAAGAPTGQLGVLNPSSTATLTVPCQVRWLGYTTVWAKVAAGGTLIAVGNQLIANPGGSGTNDAVLGAATTNKNLGLALATTIAGALVSAGTLIAVPGSNANYAKLNVDLRLT